MRKTDKYITATEARKNFFELIEKVKKSSFPVNITVKGIPEVVLMSREEYEGWMATIETLSDPELMDALRESEKEIKAGRYHLWEDVKKELGYGESLVQDKGKKKYVSNRPLKSGKEKPKKTR
jgi:antitoxin YefM